jgi:hypothetical protein
MVRGLRFLGMLVMAYALVAAAEAYSCPNCATARVVRASFVDDRFWATLLQIVLPLAVLGAIAAALYRIDLPGARARRTHVTTKEART